MRPDSKWPAFALCALVGCAAPAAKEEAPVEDTGTKAARLAQRFIIADTHIDVPYRLKDEMEDISVTTSGGDFDFPRAKQGGLNVPFFSIFTPASLQKTGESRAVADELIDMVEGIVAKHPDKFAITTSVAGVHSHFAKGRVAIALGMENGAPIGDDLSGLQHFYDRGIRYITLTHGEPNQISDSSYSEDRRWGGLSPYGREVVHEMNRLGIMVDVSHVSDDAFLQVLDATEAPVIASHSSCRKFTPGFERNMSDDMIGRLAENGGVIQINFGSSFLNEDILARSRARRDEITAYLAERGLDRNDAAARDYAAKRREEDPVPYADIEEVVEHIDHVVRLVGIDHVGLGSDFDGVGDSLPTGLKDVAAYPNLIARLLDRGYSEEQIEKVCSGNLLRVWSDVEQVAERLKL